MKILTGFHFPTEGDALVDGISVMDEPVEVKKRIGYMPESVPLYNDLTVTEYLNFIAASRRIPKEKRKAAINSALERCALGHMRDRRIETLSKGYKQRTGLSQAIIHDPPILILDEPTSGLDPNQIIEIRNLIKELGKSKTVILSTHILQEVEAVCSQVLILNAGRMAAQGRPAEIAGSLRGGETWELVLKGASAADIEMRLSGFAAEFDGRLQIVSVTDNGGLASVSCVIRRDYDANSAAERFFDWAILNSLKILQLSRKKVALEDIFVKLTTEASS
jgi:ABC-2 type transport system ATP-binding protein